jgi:hypothetical protein
MEQKRVHLNPFQQKVHLVRANRTIAVVGRGGGKTVGLIAPFLADNAIKMPRSTQRLGSYTYEGLMKNILPGVIQGWQEIYQWREGVHFFVGEWAPDSWGWKKPHFEPRGKGAERHLIHIYNGSVIQLASMDRTINNGASIDAFCLDEARLVRRKKVAEMIPAMRGNLEAFGHLSNYQSMLLTTDMPQNPSEKWVLDYEEDHTDDLVENILKIQEYLQKLYIRYSKSEGNYKRNLFEEIQRHEKRLHILRMDCTQFIEGDAIGNIHALGVRTIKRWKETMTEDEFARSVLNQRQDKVLNGFYAALDPEHHSYDDATEYSEFDNLTASEQREHERDCRMDKDYFTTQQLHIAFDHNAAINSMVIGQPRPNKECHFINAMYVLQPDYLQALIAQFTHYYRHAKNKSVVYYYDHTSIKDNSQGQEKERDEVIRLLSKAGWRVREVYVGKTDDHHEKYKMWQSVLTEQNPKSPLFRYNRVNCMQMERSMLNADVRKVGDVYKKDKSSERKDNRTKKYAVPPQDATHFSEAADTLMVGFLKHLHTTTSFGELVVV